MRNQDESVVADFGEEWARFDQSALSAEEARRRFNGYFAVFPWQAVDARSVGFDLGCGSGRWAKLVAPRVGKLYCIDPSEKALATARKNCAACANVEFIRAGVDSIPLQESSMDFGYSLGVLHHIPDALAGLRKCVHLLKPDAPFLVYLYYAFDNRPLWFRAIWRASDALRRIISRLPFALKKRLCDLIAGGIYLPLARFSAILAARGLNVERIPLSYYRGLSFYTMRTDALDRFSTRLEKRFTKRQVVEMLEAAGLARVRVSDSAPYWCAAGAKARPSPAPRGRADSPAEHVGR